MYENIVSFSHCFFSKLFPLDLSTDKQIPTLLLLIDRLLSHITPVATGDAALATDENHFNIYEDFQLEETQKAKEILDRFSEFVDQLLLEFEEHPALLQVFYLCY